MLKVEPPEGWSFGEPFTAFAIPVFALSLMCPSSSYTFSSYTSPLPSLPPHPEPSEVALVVDGKTDQCSRGDDINFNHVGFSVYGQVCIDEHCLTVHVHYKQAKAKMYTFFFFKEKTALGGIRTHDTPQSRQALYQLSYQSSSAG